MEKTISLTSFMTKNPCFPHLGCRPRPSEQRGEGPPPPCERGGLPGRRGGGGGRLLLVLLLFLLLLLGLVPPAAEEGPGAEAAAGGEQASPRGLGLLVDIDLFEIKCFVGIF